MAYDAVNISDPPVATPTAGQTVTVSPVGYVYCEIINPSGTLATMTLTLANGTQQGQMVFIAFSQIITLLTVTSTNVQSTLPLPTSAALGQGMGFAWSAALTKWIRFL